MQPSVGRIVHYHGAGQEDPTCYAALITAVHDDGTVSLAVIGPTGFHFLPRAAHADDEKYGASTWHWPERV